MAAEHKLYIPQFRIFPLYYLTVRMHSFACSWRTFCPVSHFAAMRLMCVTCLIAIIISFLLIVSQVNSSPSPCGRVFFIIIRFFSLSIRSAKFGVCEVAIQAHVSIQCAFLNITYGKYKLSLGIKNREKKIKKKKKKQHFKLYYFDFIANDRLSARFN